MPDHRPGTDDAMKTWVGPPAAYGMVVRKVEEVTILDLGGSLTQDRSAERFKTRISELLAAGAKQLAINLSRVSYIDSTGVGALLVAHNTIYHAGGSCTFFGVDEHTRQLLHRVHLDVVFRIFDNEAAAVSSC
ncbi:MAG: STAS domain-containing protein [Deltaproteobacteria bacterium]